MGAKPLVSRPHRRKLLRLPLQLQERFRVKRLRRLEVYLQRGLRVQLACPHFEQVEEERWCLRWAPLLPPVPYALPEDPQRLAAYTCQSRWLTQPASSEVEEKVEYFYQHAVVV